MTATQMMKRVIPACLLMATAASAVADPLYTKGEYGVFGNYETRGSFAAMGGITGDNSALSQSFTPLEDVTFDQITQRMGMNGNLIDSENLFIDIVEDNGGQPTGNVISSTEITLDSGGVEYRTLDLSGPVSLTAGQTYHIVTRGDGSGTDLGGENFGLLVYAGPEATSQTRPYDNGLDASATGYRFNGATWQNQNRDPYFVLSDSTINGGTVVTGPSFDINGSLYNPTIASGSQGQLFTITDKEVGSGLGVQIDMVGLNIGAYNTTKDLVVNIREVTDLQNDQSVILTSGTISASDYSGQGWYDVELNQKVSLTPGTLYMIAPEYAGGYESGDGTIVLLATFGTTLPGGNTGGYLGNDYSLVGSSGGQDWSSFGQITDRDLVFRVYGLVPEPGALSLLAGTGLLLFARRNQH